jgi:hypothetical protein
MQIRAGAWWGCRSVKAEADCVAGCPAAEGEGRSCTLQEQRVRQGCHPCTSQGHGGPCQRSLAPLEPSVGDCALQHHRPAKKPRSKAKTCKHAFRNGAVRKSQNCTHPFRNGASHQSRKLRAPIPEWCRTPMPKMTSPDSKYCASRKAKIALTPPGMSRCANPKIARTQSGIRPCANPKIATDRPP